MLTRQRWAYARTLCTSGKKLSFPEEDRTSLPLTLIVVPFSMIPIAAGGEYLSCSMNQIRKITVRELLRGHVVSLPACVSFYFPFTSAGKKYVVGQKQIFTKEHVKCMISQHTSFSSR